jgi:chromatin remodeling complex protein RSC6
MGLKIDHIYNNKMATPVQSKQKPAAASPQVVKEAKSSNVNPQSKPAAASATASPAVKEAKPAASATASPAVKEAKPAAKTVFSKPVAAKSEAETVPSEPASPPVAEVPVSSGESSSTAEPVPPKGRREVTLESVNAEFNSLLAEMTAELSKDSADKNPKYLKSLYKRLVVLQKDVIRVSPKKRTMEPRPNSNNSGLMKQFTISEEMAKFVGVSPNSKMSRVELGKLLHKYIVDNNLQNPENRREIVPNKALSKVLGYKPENHVDSTLNARKEPKNPDGKLYYYVVQQLIQKHFVIENK